MTDENQRTRRRAQISQETIAIVTVGVALAGLILVTTGDLREEARANRAAWQAESQQLRNEWQEESRQLRDEARADRTAWQAESQKLRDDFQREILRLTREQAELAAIVASTQPTNE